MRLSTKGRYGLRAMFYLALKYGEGPVPLSEISEEQSISISYLEQLFSSLKKRKLVESIRGTNGGYMLAKHPKETVVGDILRALEGSLAPTDCVTDGAEGNFSYNNHCVTQHVWRQIKESITQVVDAMTLEDMVLDYNSMNNCQTCVIEKKYKSQEMTK